MLLILLIYLSFISERKKRNVHGTQMLPQLINRKLMYIMHEICTHNTTYDAEAAHLLSGFSGVVADFCLTDNFVRTHEGTAVKLNALLAEA